MLFKAIVRARHRWLARRIDETRRHMQRELFLHRRCMEHLCAELELRQSQLDAATGRDRKVITP